MIDTRKYKDYFAYFACTSVGSLFNFFLFYFCFHQLFSCLFGIITSLVF